MRINMSLRSLIDVILKVIGIFFIRDILEALSRSLSVLVYFPQYSSQKEAFFNLGVTIPPLVLYSIFAWLLIFRTGSLIRLMRIDNTAGDQPAGFSFSRFGALTVAVVLAGCWILVNEVPEFFRLAVNYYQERVLYDRMVRPDYTYPAMSLAKIIIGLGLIIFNTPFVHLIEAISKNRLPGFFRKTIRRPRRRNNESSFNRKASLKKKVEE
jgi:hypothetical protein